MFTFKLLRSSLNSTRLSQRHISAGSGRLLGFFKGEEKKDESVLEVVDHEEEIDQEEWQKSVDQLRNKSRLLPQHRNMLREVVPYKRSESWVHETLKYKRKMYGKYGSKSNVDPRICFWTESELMEKNEYERVAFPKTVTEMMQINEQVKQAKRDRIAKREITIEKNLEKLGQWSKDIEMRKEKKETEARVAKERKDRLIEEVRRHFGYTIDPRDDRFKEMLDMKEKQMRKVMKEKKRADKETKLMSKLIDEKPDKKAEPAEDVDEDEDDVHDDDDEKKKK